MAPDSETPPRVPWLPVNEGADAGAPSAPEQLTPTKPPVPAWIQRDPVPQSVEDDDDEAIIAPVQPPSADEVLPPLGVAPAFDDEVDDMLNETRDPVRLLGDTAVASAALSAAGAPTPLGGVPMVPAEDAVQAPSFADGSPQFTPHFIDDEATDETQNETSGAAVADSLAAGIVAHEQASLAARAADLDAGAAYAPRAFDVAATEDDAADGDEPGAEPTGDSGDLAAAAPLASGGEPLADPADEAGEPPVEPPVGPTGKGRGKWWLWVVIALVAIAAGLGVAALVYEPEPIVNPGTTVTLEAPAPTITPIAAPTATDFQAAMPTTVGTFSLVEATPLDPTDVALGAGRIADGVDLTYRSGSTTMHVRAFQYFSEDEAQEMFAQFAGDPEVTEPVEAGGTVVGERAPITDPAPGIVWRNGTSVFILTGPAAELAGFYEQFGL